MAWNSILFYVHEGFCVPGARGGPLEREFEMVVSHPVDVGNRDLRKREHQCS